MASFLRILFQAVLLAFSVCCFDPLPQNDRVKVPLMTDESDPFEDLVFDEDVESFAYFLLRYLRGLQYPLHTCSSETRNNSGRIRNRASQTLLHSTGSIMVCKPHVFYCANNSLCGRCLKECIDPSSYSSSSSFTLLTQCSVMCAASFQKLEESREAQSYLDPLLVCIASQCGGFGLMNEEYSDEAAVAPKGEDEEEGCNEEIAPQCETYSSSRNSLANKPMMLPIPRITLPILPSHSSPSSPSSESGFSFSSSELQTPSGTKSNATLEKENAPHHSFHQLYVDYISQRIPFIIGAPSLCNVSSKEMATFLSKILGSTTATHNPINARHTTHILTPSERMQYVSALCDFPFRHEEIHWSATSMWGGLLGSGASRHIDLVCSPAFAFQVKGVKQWRLHRFDSHVESTSLGANLHGSEVYDGMVHEGETLVFYPWLPHETTLWASNSASMHGILLIQEARLKSQFEKEVALPSYCKDHEEGDLEDHL